MLLELLELLDLLSESLLEPDLSMPSFKLPFFGFRCLFDFLSIVIRFEEKGFSVVYVFNAVIGLSVIKGVRGALSLSVGQIECTYFDLSIFKLLPGNACFWVLGG